MFAIVLSVSLAKGAISASCPSQGEGVPMYFSGTKAIASGSVSTNTGILVAMRLYLNDELVASWDWVAGSLVQFQGSLRVMFDSSHFAAGSPVTVRMWGRNNADETAEATRAIVAKNRVVALNTSEFASQWGGDGANVVGILTSGMNDQQILQLEGWTPGDCLTYLEDPSIWYVNASSLETLGQNQTSLYWKPVHGLRSVV